MKLKVNFKQTRATSAVDIKPLNLLVNITVDLDNDILFNKIDKTAFQFCDDEKRGSIFLSVDVYCIHRSTHEVPKGVCIFAKCRKNVEVFPFTIGALL